ncbi:MAG: ATPase domain-containing protein [Promethearchaeia archaeon]
MDITLEEIDGMGTVTAKQLRQSGICTVSTLAYQDPIYLADDIDISKHKTRVLIRNAREMLPHTKLHSAIQVETELRKKARLSTGIKEPDGLLHGGFPRGSFIYMCGRSQSGKTHWCHQFAVTSQLPPEDGGLDGRVIWLDCERGFSPLIIRANAIRFQLDPDDVMANIKHVSILTQDHMVDYLHTLAPLCCEDTALVVCDCLGMLFPSEIQKRERYNTTVDRLLTVLQTFKNLALTTDTTFLYTNQMYDRFLVAGGSYLFLSNNNLMGQISDYRSRVHAPATKERKRFNLVDGPDIPPFKFTASLLWGGFYDRRCRTPPETVIQYVNEELEKWYPGITDKDEGPLYT